MGPGQPAFPGKVARAERRGCGRTATKRVNHSRPSGARSVATARSFAPVAARGLRRSLDLRQRVWPCGAWRLDDECAYFGFGGLLDQPARSNQGEPSSRGRGIAEGNRIGRSVADGAAAVCAGRRGRRRGVRCQFGLDRAEARPVGGRSRGDGCGRVGASWPRNQSRCGVRCAAFTGRRIAERPIERAAPRVFRSRGRDHLPPRSASPLDRSAGVPLRLAPVGRGRHADRRSRLPGAFTQSLSPSTTGARTVVSHELTSCGFRSDSQLNTTMCHETRWM